MIAVAHPVALGVHELRTGSPVVVSRPEWLSWQSQGVLPVGFPHWREGRRRFQPVAVESQTTVGPSGVPPQHTVGC